MRYLQCGLAAEGPTDHRFLGPLLHRLVDSIVLRDRRYDVEIPDVQPVLPSGRPVNDPSDVSQAVKEEYGHLDLLFFHSDAKGNPPMVSAVRGGRRRTRREEDFLGVWAQRLDLAELQRLSQGRQLAEDTAAALRTLAVIR